MRDQARTLRDFLPAGLGLLTVIAAGTALSGWTSGAGVLMPLIVGVAVYALVAWAIRGSRDERRR